VLCYFSYSSLQRFSVIDYLAVARHFMKTFIIIIIIIIIIFTITIFFFFFIIIIIIIIIIVRDSSRGEVFAPVSICLQSAQIWSSYHNILDIIIRRHNGHCPYFYKQPLLNPDIIGNPTVLFTSRDLF
jgi:hypothetical protein